MLATATAVGRKAGQRSRATVRSFSLTQPAVRRGGGRGGSGSTVVTSNSSSATTWAERQPLFGQYYTSWSHGVSQRCLFSSSSSDDSSSSASFSSYEYPTRSEAPIVTATTAVEANLRLEREPRTPSPAPLSSSSPSTTSNSLLEVEVDPFDDACQFTDDEVKQERQKQKHWLEQEQLKLNSFPILPDVPTFIPPNVSSQELEAPQTFITTLSNGVRVVSQETYGQMCTVGVLTNVGSRHEPQVGMMHLLETLAFSSTKNYPDHINESLQDWGATRFVSISREQTLHCIDVLRPNVEHAMALISDVLLEPNLSEPEIEHCKAVLRIQAQEAIPELALGEALQMAAYGQDQQLGRLHFATMEAVDALQTNTVVDFYQSTIRHNPKGMVVAGAGIGHDELVTLANKYFGTVTEHPVPIMTIPSVYRGGSHLIENNHAIDPSTPTEIDGEEYIPIITPPDEFCRVALAFPLGGWHSETMVTACVLQTLLGGGSSFSAGGPGKGMYSRMYQNVLNRYGWMETAEAFTSFADEGGLFGVSGSTAQPTKVLDLVTILADQMARLAVQPVSQIELTRARNMLKCNVLSQLESRLILFEDMGRQVLTYGAREDSQTTCRKIDAVTVDDIQQLAQSMLEQPPTLAATGAHLDKVPSYEEVSRWFQQQE